MKFLITYSLIMSLLTPRWFDINPKALNHKVQSELKSDLMTRKYDNFVIAAGRRSFKTERFLKRFFVLQAIQNDNKTFYLGAPTRIQAKEIFWSDIKKLTPSWLLNKTSESELKLTYHGDTTLQVVGLKEFKRVQGTMAHGIGVSEFQDCEPEVYNESFEPMLNDTNGFSILEGRPFGKNHLYDFYLKGENGEKGWKNYHWTAEDILTFEQIERAKGNLAKGDYEREYLASFETEFGSPYYSFSKLNNKKHNLIQKLPILVTCDFNATEKPMSWVIGQRLIENTFDVTYWTKCLSSSFTNTEQQSLNLIDYFKKQFGSLDLHLIFYGDFAGNHETSNSSFTDWQIIEKIISPKVRKFEKKLKPCRSIRDSIGATNAQLCNTLGQRKQFINFDECKPLVLDCEKIGWKPNGRELEDKDPERGHACRAVDYYNDYEHGIQPKPTTITGHYA